MKKLEKLTETQKEIGHDNAKTLNEIEKFLKKENYLVPSKNIKGDIKRLIEYEAVRTGIMENERKYFLSRGLSVLVTEIKVHSLK